MFILCLEVLSKLLYFTVQHHLLRGYKPSRGGPVVSHLLFADYYLLVAKATVKDIACLKAIIDTYCEISGQNINVSKSPLQISPKTPNDIKSQIKYITHMNAISRAWKYLGVPIAMKELKGL